MPFDAHKNLAVAQAANAPGTGGTSLVVGTGQGARFPAAPFNATVYPAGFTPDPTNAEIVRVTAIAGDTLTITRAQEGATARNIGVGDVVSAGVTAKTLSDIELNRSVTRSAASASASTVLTTLLSYPIMAGEITPGAVYEFELSLRLINTTTATNAVVTVSVGATDVLVMTQAIGTTAAASPGAPVLVKGTITFYSATQAECTIHYARSQAVAANVVLNTSAPITVSAAGATTIDIKFNTSGATSTFIARSGHIRRA